MLQARSRKGRDGDGRGSGVWVDGVCGSGVAGTQERDCGCLAG